MIEQIEAYRLTCEKCGHKWIALEAPARCAKCKYRGWNEGETVATAPKPKIPKPKPTVSQPETGWKRPAHAVGCCCFICKPPK